MKRTTWQRTTALIFIWYLLVGCLSITNVNAQYKTYKSTNDRIGQIPFIESQFINVDDVPSELMFFKARMVNDKVNCYWMTKQYADFKHFEVQRTNDGTFQTISKVDDSENNMMIGNYKVADYKPFDGNSFYRLKLVDENGDVSYSDPVSVFNVKETIEASIEPGMNRGTINVRTGYTREEVRLSVYNADGRLQTIRKIPSLGNDAKVMLDLSDELQPGEYYLELEKGGKRETTRFAFE